MTGATPYGATVPPVRPPTAVRRLGESTVGPATIVSLSADALAAVDARDEVDDRDIDVSPEADEVVETGETEGENAEPVSPTADRELTPEQETEVKELKARDAEVRRHEQAHASIGGSYAGAPSYEFQRGPDGQNYAVGGEVQIDVSEVSGDPRATIEKMQVVIAAALAPAEPSGADRAVARQAQQTLAAARTEALEAEEAEKDSQSESPDALTGPDDADSERAGSSAASTTSQNAYRRGAQTADASAFAGQLLTVAA